jgi:twitching motility protein PilJ
LEHKDMSFLSRIKDLGKSQDEDEVQSEALSTEGMVTSSGAQTVDTQASPSTIQPGHNTADSIISESAPSEFPPDYHDARQRPDAPSSSLMEPQSGLPVIGTWRLARRQ